MKIVGACEADFEEMWPTIQEVWAAGDSYAHLPDTSRQTAHDYFMGTGVQPYIARNDEGNFLGFYRIAPIHWGLGSHIATASFMVKADCRGTGIGKKLTQHALVEAARAGYKAMRFNNVVSTNHGAIMLYLKLGFKIIGTVPKAFKSLRMNDYVDVYVMYRSLEGSQF